MPEDLARDPLKPFTDNRDALDLTLARDCLQLYLYRMMERTTGRDRLSGHFLDQNLDVSAFRERLMKDNAGAKALSWLLHSTKHEQIETVFDIKFIQATTCCLVGEGKTDIWWDMLKIQHTPKQANITTMLHRKYRQVAWYDAWFTAIMEAQAFWATGKNRLNDSLATFLEVVRLNREERTFETRIPIAGAINWLNAKLPYHDTRHINVEAWDSFCSKASEYFGGEGPFPTRLTHAQMQLNHPANRSVDPLLDLLRRSEFDEEAMRWLGSMNRGTLILIVRKMVQFCYSAGRMNDVRWTLDFFYWIERQHELEARRPNRKATRQEIAAGIPVDAHGRVFPKVRWPSDITHTHTTITDDV